MCGNTGVGTKVNAVQYVQETRICILTQSHVKDLEDFNPWLCSVYFMRSLCILQYLYEMGSCESRTNLVIQIKTPVCFLSSYFCVFWMIVIIDSLIRRVPLVRVCFTLNENESAFGLVSANELTNQNVGNVNIVKHN